MRAPVFADAVYWIALANERDQWHAAAVAASESIGNRRLVTTETLLCEVLAGLARAGELMRGRAVEMVRTLQRHPNAEVIEQSRALFREGVEFYEAAAGQELQPG